MKELKIEYHPNGCIKHKIGFYDNGYKINEFWYDENEILHRINAPACQYWYKNKKTFFLVYYAHGKRYNINNPSSIYFKDNENGKILNKYYSLNNNNYSKLIWMKNIKNI